MADWDKPPFSEIGAAIGDAGSVSWPSRACFPRPFTLHESGTPVAFTDRRHKFITAIMESLMRTGNEQIRTVPRLNLMDAVLYLVAGSAMTLISFTFLLWLLF
jgi:hypothetical protein